MRLVLTGRIWDPIWNGCGGGRRKAGQPAPLRGGSSRFQKPFRRAGQPHTFGRQFIGWTQKPFPARLLALRSGVDWHRECVRPGRPSWRHISAPYMLEFPVRRERSRICFRVVKPPSAASRLHNACANFVADVSPSPFHAPCHKRQAGCSATGRAGGSRKAAQAGTQPAPPQGDVGGQPHRESPTQGYFWGGDRALTVLRATEKIQFQKQALMGTS
jgi:hypothetical protein